MYSIFTLHVYTTRLLLRGKTQTLLLGACSLSLCALLRSIEIWVESRDSGVMPSFLVITSSLIPFSCFNSTVHVSTKWKSMSTFFGPLVFKKTFFFSCFDLVPQSLRLALLSSSWSHIKKHCIDSKACDFPSFGMHKAHNLFELKLERCQGRHLGSELSLCGFSKALAPWKAAAKGSDVWSPFTGQSLDVFTGFMLHVDNKRKSNQLLVDIWCLRADCAAECYETLSRWTGVKAAVMPNKAWKWGCRFSSLAGADDPCAIRLLQRPGCESAPGCFLLSLSPSFCLKSKLSCHNKG